MGLPTKRCEKCRHWDAPADVYDKGFGTCTGILHGEEVRNAPFVTKSRTEYGNWNEVERVEKEHMAACKAYVEDASSYQASLYTKPDFGCVLFAAKP